MGYFYFWTSDLHHSLYEIINPAAMHIFCSQFYCIELYEKNQICSLMSATNIFDFVVIGGGIVGTATAYKLSLKFPKKTIALIEKESTLGSHQTGRNSGVIHSGIYYKPGSLKAENCRVGREQLVKFSKNYGIHKNSFLMHSKRIALSGKMLVPHFTILVMAYSIWNSIPR